MKPVSSTPAPSLDQINNQNEPTELEPNSNRLRIKTLEIKALRQKSLQGFIQAKVDNKINPTIDIRGDRFVLGCVDGSFERVESKFPGFWRIHGSSTQLNQDKTFPNEFSHKPNSLNPDSQNLQLPAKKSGASGDRGLKLEGQSQFSSKDAVESVFNPQDVTVSRPDRPQPIPFEHNPKSSAYDYFAAAVTQLFATGLTFGIKPFVEAAVETTLLNKGLTNHSKLAGVALPRLISNATGGAFVGLIHHSVSASVSAYVLSQMGANSKVDVSEDPRKRELNSFLTGSLPVALAFTASFSGGRVLSTHMPEQLASSLWIQAAMRCTQSLVAAAPQGVMTLAIKNALDDSFETRKTEPMEASEIVTKFRNSLSQQFDPQNTPVFMQETVAKVLGSTIGMIAATYAGDRVAKFVLDPKNGPVAQQAAAQGLSGAAGMLTYLTSWFGAVHLAGIANAPSETGTSSGTGNRPGPSGQAPKMSGETAQTSDAALDKANPVQKSIVLGFEDLLTIVDYE